MSNSVPDSLGKYHIHEMLGQGGMGEVYKAYDPVLERFVALKILRSHRSDAEGLKRFRREATAIARLRHPHIVRVYDFDSKDGLDFMVMEFIEGPTLKQEMRRRNMPGHGASLETITQGVGATDAGGHGQALSSPAVAFSGEASKAAGDSRRPYTLLDVVRIFTELASAVEYAHSRNMVHHDLKPTNIMFSAEGQVVLTDFGIARILGTDHTLSNVFSGTPAYMSPEQSMGNRDDPRSDIYALGIILFELITGQRPFEAENIYGYVKQHVEVPAPDPTTIRPELPQAVARVILHSLNKRPEKRYQSAGELAAALQAAVGLAPAMAVSQIAPQIEWSLVEKLTTTGVGAPFQAPHDTAHFVGRKGLVAQLTEKMTEPVEHRFFCLTGMGGVGKTALATHLAHRLRSHFPDGVLWANLATSEPLAILDSWAKAYGLNFSSLPDLASRSAAFRSEMSHKKALMILDDVWDAGQARSLLPSGAENVVLITTRDQDMALMLDAQPVPVSVLPRADSRQLLIHIVGEDRVRAEMEVAEEIGQLLGHLPLAVKIAARLLVSRGRWRLADLAERLGNERSRLAALKIKDQQVRTSFAVSWEALAPELRHSFALLSVFEGRPFRISALAMVAGVERATAEEHLFSLVALSLVGEQGRTHYRQHPLLADFAREHLDQPEPAYQRMTQYYLAYATRYQGDYSALELEWDNLLASMRVAHRQEAWQRLIQYADVLHQAWFARARYGDARQGYAWASQAAETVVDRLSLAAILSRWGQACIEQGDYEEAEAHLQRSLVISQELSAQVGVASAQYHLGRIAIERAQYDKAQELLEASKQIREEISDMSGVAETLLQQANIQYYHDYHRANQLLNQALEIQQSTGDRQGSIRILRSLAEVAANRTGDVALAEKYCQRALALCEEFNDQGELAITLYTLSKIYLQKGELQAARDNGERSLTLLKRMGDRKSQAQVLLKLSQVDLELASYELALKEGQQSLQLCRELEDSWGAVYVLSHLGNLHQVSGQVDAAQDTWSEALTLARQIQHPLVEPLQEKLAD